MTRVSGGRGETDAGEPSGDAMKEDGRAYDESQAWDEDAAWASKTVVAMFLAIAIPAFLTLSVVRETRPLVDIAADPTPYGYTRSLLLYLMPIGTIAAWFTLRLHYGVPKRAFWWTVAILSPLGIGLDILFAGLFFRFPNPAAVVGIRVPGYLPGQGFRVWIPFEEVVFYVAGFIFVLLLYLWLDEFWLRAYNRNDYGRRSARIPAIIRLDWRALTVGAVLIPAAVLVKRLGPHPEGFPGYFTFIVAFSVIPTVLFLKTASPFINWRAVSVTMFVGLLVSLLWEATLGIPYQWWGYQRDRMLGYSIHAWSDLPIEEPLVWMMVTWLSVIVYEVVKVRQHMSERTLPEALVGRELPGRRRPRRGGAAARDAKPHPERT